MLFVDTDLAEAKRAQQAAAGGVLDEYAREQLPRAGLLGLRDQRRIAGRPAPRPRCVRATYTENSAMPA